MDDHHSELNGRGPSNGGGPITARSVASDPRAVSPTTDGAPPRTLLLVDDEENILASLRRLFRRAGYRILTASSGREGLELLNANAVDVIISDQRMPNMTGVEFLRQAKEVCPDSIRIVLSGYTELQSIADAINEGAIYKFLTKPWLDDELRSQIEEAFARKAAADETRRLQQELTISNQAQAELNARLESLLEQKQSALDRDEVSLLVTKEILEHLPLPIIGVDTHDMITFANAAAQTLFGEFAPLLGADARDVLPMALQTSNGETDGKPIDVSHDGRAFSAITRSMGVHSIAQGRIHVLLPSGK